MTLNNKFTKKKKIEAHMRIIGINEIKQKWFITN